MNILSISKPSEMDIENPGRILKPRLVDLTVWNLSFSTLYV
jgi:hypothetical protein